MHTLNSVKWFRRVGIEKCLGLRKQLLVQDFFLISSVKLDHPLIESFIFLNIDNKFMKDLEGSGIMKREAGKNVVEITHDISKEADANYLYNNLESVFITVSPYNISIAHRWKSSENVIDWCYVMGLVIFV